MCIYARIRHPSPDRAFRVSPTARNRHGVVENSRVLALVGAVVTADTYIFVAREQTFQIVKLLFETFLGTEDIEIMEAHQFSHTRRTHTPAIAGLVVALVELPDIIGSDIE